MCVYGGYGKKAAIQKPRTDSPEETNLLTPDLGLLASKTVKKNTFLLYRPHNLWYLLWKPEQTNALHQSYLIQARNRGRRGLGRGKPT